MIIYFHVPYPEGGLMKNRSSNLSVMIPFLFLAVNVREC